jgi:hypothetical protein
MSWPENITTLFNYLIISIMKFAKIFFSAFILMAIASAFVTPKHNLVVPQKSELKIPVNVDIELVWDGTTLGSDFTLGSAGGPLAVVGNYEGSFRAGGNVTCSGLGKFCKARITYTYESTDGDPLPRANQSQIDQSIADIVNQISTNYNSGGSPNYFPGYNSSNGTFTFTFSQPLSSVVITIVISQKS